MKENTIRAIGNCHGRMEARYPGYDQKPAGERALLAFADLESMKIRESGNNRGEWVEVFLESAGVGPGNPWCASALTFACKVAGLAVPTGPAAVRNWHQWFKARGKLVKTPKRGDVCMKDSGGGKGHIGIVVRVVGPLVYSIEGNTGSGDAGNQRDGDGLYRRVRTRGFWSWGFGSLG